MALQGKEFETRLKEKKPGDLSDELRIALGMPVGPVSFTIVQTLCKFNELNHKKQPTCFKLTAVALKHTNLSAYQQKPSLGGLRASYCLCLLCSWAHLDLSDETL